MRRSIYSDAAFEREVGYARAVVDDPWVFVSGTTGFDYTTMTIADDAAEQASQCLENICAALDEAGSALEDVLRVTYIVPTLDDFKACIPVLRKHFATIAPAATMFCAELFDPRCKIEIEVTARKPKRPAA
jgi:enamine deaminase RidA (YjgF/YER057c/UK114 family)